MKNKTAFCCRAQTYAFQSKEIELKEEEKT